MNLAEQIGRWMSLRAPQRGSLARLHAIAEAVDFKRRRAGAPNLPKRSQSTHAGSSGDTLTRSRSNTLCSTE